MDMKYLILYLFSLFIIVAACNEAGIDSLNETDHLSNSAVEAADAHHGGNYALSFDGVSDYLVAAHDESLDMTDGFTIAARIYIEEYVEWASIVTKGGVPGDQVGANNYTLHQSGPDGGGLELYETEFGHIRFTGDGSSVSDSSPESSTLLSLNTWHHITATYDGNTLRYYLNGKPDGEYEIGGPLVPNGDPLYIGVDPPGDDEYWNGMIDEIKIWNRPLNRGQIRAAMRGSATPLASALVAYWPFNEGSGSEAHDLSGNGNHATFVGSPTWVHP